MIAEATVKTLARIQGVDPAVIDRDHALGVVLWALNQQLTAQGWVFKGGTCLRKCYFGDYRFSEDLDFTVIGRLNTEGALATIAACEPAASSQGIRLLLEDARAEVMDDEYGRESIEIKVPYRGALRMGSAPNVQFHLSADEELAFEPLLRPLLHPYDDALGLACELRSYALEEVLTEKLRAAAGQREYAVARDIYDIANVVSRGWTPRPPWPRCLARRRTRIWTLAARLSALWRAGTNSRRAGSGRSRTWWSTTSTSSRRSP